MARPRITAEQAEALRIIERRVAPTGCVWAITGSIAFALQGLDFTPEDIDLQTDREGAFQLEAALSEFMIEPVRLRESERIRSYFGAAEIKNIRVEIMGDLQKRLPTGEWTEPTDVARHRRWIEWEGIRLPVLSLRYEYEAYSMLGRKETAGKLRAWLDRPG